ncbi:MAG: hypothetical protein R3B70_07110 [Polyangiaceae bacterium]
MGASFSNPFRPGAGHRPPYLAGRVAETDEFRKLLKQDVVLENLILTGLRGLGKTVLLDTFKPLAIEAGWLWAGTDLSESSSISEERLALRLLTDLSVVTAGIAVAEKKHLPIGFGREARKSTVALDYNTLEAVFSATPGLVADKLKAVLALVAAALAGTKHRGIVFAYDEAQNLADHAEHNEFPLSLLLDVFQSLQRRNAPFLLVLTGLPTIFPKLVEARIYSERMFRVVFLDRLTPAESRDAITKPIEDANCPVQLPPASLKRIVELSDGYPYFIQFVCREVFDAVVQGQTAVPVDEITRKLDTDFFSGRWSRATDRQRQLLVVVAQLENAASEFSVQEIAEASAKLLEKPFSSSHISQILSALTDAGLIYKNRYGKYSLAVPLLDQFILRQIGRVPRSTPAPRSTAKQRRKKGG